MLTELGKQQAKSAAETLRKKCIQVIYTSPLIRAYETARIVAESLGINEVIAHSLLVERDFGILTGKPVADIRKYSKKVLTANHVDYFLDAEGAEEFPVAYSRAKKVIDQIARPNRDKNILIVTHGDIGKMIFAAYQGLSWREGLSTPYFDNATFIELA